MHMMCCICTAAIRRVKVQPGTLLVKLFSVRVPTLDSYSVSLIEPSLSTLSMSMSSFTGSMTSPSWRLSVLPTTADSSAISVTWSADGLNGLSRRCVTSSRRDTGSSDDGWNDVTTGGGIASQRQSVTLGGGRRNGASWASEVAATAATAGEQLTNTRGNWSPGDALARATVRALHGAWLMIDGGLWRMPWPGEVSSTPVELRRRWSELRRCSADARCSAASALLRFSCFFHFVRRFWNHIFTCSFDHSFIIY